jgi:hypothetical protein
MIYRHKKTGNLYRWLAAGVDATNERDGLMVAIYCEPDDGHSVYVREMSEFNEKFEPVESQQ